MMASAILLHGGSKRGEKREEAPSSLSSLRGASLTSCVASRNNLGEANSACSMVFFFMLVALITWWMGSRGEISRVLPFDCFTEFSYCAVRLDPVFECLTF
jgi:hypothetical protein